MKLIETHDVAKLLRPGMSVFIQGGAGEPTDFVKALRQNPDACAGVEFISVQTPGVNRTDFAALHSDAEFTTFFLIPEAMASQRAGRLRFVPLHYSDIDRYLASRRIDMAMLQLTAPNANGECNAGISCEFTPTLLNKSVVVMAELNSGMPWLTGGLTVPAGRIQYAAPVSHALIESGAGSSSPAAVEVARHAATLIRDGDTLQVGVGRLPALILRALHERNDLGFHSGLITEGILERMRKGNITNSRKPIDRGMSIGTVALGSAAFYAELAMRPDIRLRPISYTHDVETIARLADFVSINSAIEVDLDGQVNAEQVHNEQIGGTGGFVDFVRGARRAANGRSIVAMEATARAGTVSRIRPRLTSAVTCLRGDVDYVVTEYGIADLRHASMQERRQSLIRIAAPQFRDELAAATRA